MGGHMPYNAQNLCQSAGCDAASLAPVTYLTDAQKQYIIDHTGGVWNTYKPAAFAYNTKRDAIIRQQVFDVGVAGNGPIPADSENYADQLIHQSQTFGNCSIIPAGQQATFYPNGDCNQSWIATTASLTVPAIPPSTPDTSTWASPPGGASANPVSPNFTPLLNYCG